MPWTVNPDHGYLEHFNSAGSLGAVTDINVDTSTPPGTDPVLPDGSGSITFTGAQVFSAAVGANVLRTNSLAASSVTYQIQQSGASAAENTTLNGVSHFNSSDFSVSNGFVSITDNPHVAEQFQTQSGTATPAAHLLKVFGTGATSTSAPGSSNIVSINTPNCAKWIVDPVAGFGTHTTITGALASASSGETIFIRPGTYTENITLKAGVNLVAFEVDGFTPTVTIVGKCSYSAAGTTSIGCIRLQTNADFFLEVTGSSASTVNLRNCYLNCTNNTGISFTSSSGSAFLLCETFRGDIGTTGIALYSHSSAGSITFKNGVITNTGLSSTASNNSSGVVNLVNFSILSPISTSSTGSLAVSYSFITPFPTNSTALVINSTGSNSVNWTRLNSGTASAISVGALATIIADYIFIQSSNANVVTGAGTFRYSCVSQETTPGAINATTLSGDELDVGTLKLLNPLAGGGIPSTDKSGNFNAAVNNGYFCSAALTATLPASPTQGDMIIIQCDTTGAVVITANTGQVIRIGTNVSSSAGTATSTLRGDSVTLRYRSSGTAWIAQSNIGSWTTA